jgi:hypothetical protein
MTRSRLGRASIV